MVDGVAPIDRKGIAIFAITMAVITIAGWLGEAFFPTLLKSAPLLLIACNPRLRYLVLVSPTVDVVPFVVVAVGRLLLTDPLFFWFGRRYGDVSIRWMERKLGPSASVILWIEKAFKRSSHAAVIILPNNWICLLAGATKMRWWVFGILNFGGTFARILLIRAFGHAFADPILSFNSWIADHRLQLTTLTVLLVAITIWQSVHSGRTTLETPDELAEELIEAAEDISKPGEPVD